LTGSARQSIQRWVFVLTFLLGVPALLVWLSMPFLDMSHATYLTAAKDYQGAIRALNRAVAFNGGLSSAYVKRGYDYEQLNQPDKALADYDTAIRINGQDWSAYNNRAWLIAQTKDPKAAMEDASKAVQLCPTCAQAFHTRGMLYSKMSDTPMAIADFTRAIELDPKFEAAVEDRAKLQDTGRGSQSLTPAPTVTR
jgi:tetratricopeptide (TPR) repeat protein